MDCEEMSDFGKALRDAIFYGTGWIINGKYVHPTCVEIHYDLPAN
jgi:hypothetical protein